MFIFTSSENSLNAMLHEHAYMHDVLCFKKIIFHLNLNLIVFFKKINKALTLSPEFLTSM